MTELIKNKKKIKFLKGLFFRNSDKNTLDKYMKEMKVEVSKEIRQRKELIKIITFYTNNNYIKISLEKDLMLSTTDELLDILEQITEMTRKLI